MPISREEFNKAIANLEKKGSDINIEHVFNKFKNSSPEDLEKLLRLCADTENGRGDKKKMLKLKTKPYLEYGNYVVDQNNVIYLSARTSDPFFVVLFERRSIDNIHTDALVPFDVNGAVQAFLSTQQYEVIYEELLVGAVVKVSIPEWCIAALLISVEFVDNLMQRLLCENKDELVVIPVSDTVMFATKSSSFLGCCYIGDVCDPLAANENFPNYLTSRPLAVETIVRGMPVEESIAQGLSAVRWKLYSRYGDDAFGAVIIATDGKLQFTVPTSEASADAIMQLYSSGSRPLVVPLVVGRWGNCYRCLKFGHLRVCSRCKQAYYCNRDCQRLDWNTHRPKCNSRAHQG